MMEDEKDHPQEKHVKWDEEKLKETEKYRGQFAKIDEPKTPYHQASDVLVETLRATKTLRDSRKGKRRCKSISPCPKPK